MTTMTATATTRDCRRWGPGGPHGPAMCLILLRQSGVVRVWSPHSTSEPMPVYRAVQRPVAARLASFPPRQESLRNPMRILLLEDDRQLGPWVAGGLREEGHVVDHFDDGKDALLAAMGQDYDLLILDRMVPGLDGLAVLKSLRASKNTTPALFLTALGEVDARVEGFDAGGDDYLTKPFAFAELSARVNALGRRQGGGAQTAEQTVLRFADLSLDLLSRRCERQGQEIELLAKEFKLLEYFMRRPGRLVTRTMLLEQVWDMSFDPTTSVVETHISRLRAKIDKPFDADLIRTRRGEGYVFGK